MIWRLQALPGGWSLVRKTDRDEGRAEFRRAVRDVGDGSGMVQTLGARVLGVLP